MFKRQKPKEIFISKLLDDLPGMEDVIVDPRSYSPDRLKDACNNIQFNPSEEIDPIENITCQFIFRNFFYIMHQTGLYNPQRRLFNHIASVEKVVIREFKKLTKVQKEAGKISDLYFYDINGRFLLIRLEHPNSKLDFVALPKLFSDANNSKCLGAIYVSNLTPSEPVMDLVRKKTSFDNESEKYISPLANKASFNFISYEANPSSVTYNLLHPNLDKQESVSAVVSAELIKVFYESGTSLIG